MCSGYSALGRKGTAFLHLWLSGKQCSCTSQVRNNAQERWSLWHFCTHGASVQIDTTKLKCCLKVNLCVLLVFIFMQIMMTNWFPVLGNQLVPWYSHGLQLYDSHHSPQPEPTHSWLARAGPPTIIYFATTRAAREIRRRPRTTCRPCTVPAVCYICSRRDHGCQLDRRQGTGCLDSYLILSLGHCSNLATLLTAVCRDDGRPSPRGHVGPIM